MSSVLRPSSHRSSFLECVDAAKAGDRDGINEVIAECLPHITSYVARRGSADPEALANLVAMEFLRNLGRLEFGSDGQAWSYLYRIARSRLVDEHRRLGAQRKHGELLEADKSERDFDQEIVDRLWVDDALDVLTEEQRTVVELRFLKDLSIAETAERTGKSTTAVKGLQRRALKQLAAVVALAVLVVLAGVALLVNGPAVDLPKIQTGGPDTNSESESEENSIGGGGSIDATGSVATDTGSGSDPGGQGVGQAVAGSATTGPSLDAGPNLRVAFRAPVQLRPTFDGDAASTTLRWTQYSGPEEAVFTGDWSNAQASFPQWGTYILTIVAESDGRIVASDNLMVTVLSPLIDTETSVPTTTPTTVGPTTTTPPTTAPSTTDGNAAPTSVPPVTAPPSSAGPTTSIQVGPTATDNEAAGPPIIDESTLTSPNLVLSGSFEGGQAANLGVVFAAVPGWTTTGPSGQLEIWSSGNGGVNAPHGDQFIELNAYDADTISQSVTVTPGTRYLFSLSHRARSDADRVEILVDGVGVGTHTSRGAWLRVQTVVTVPPGVTQLTIGVRAVDTGSVGNFIDDVRFRSLD